jgi:hypothetical protein
MQPNFGPAVAGEPAGYRSARAWWSDGSGLTQSGKSQWPMTAHTVSPDRDQTRRPPVPELFRSRTTIRGNLMFEPFTAERN